MIISAVVVSILALLGIWSNLGDWKAKKAKHYNL